MLPDASPRATLFLIDPVMLSQLILKYLILAEPQTDLFLRTFDGIGAVADVSANVLCCKESDACVVLYLKYLRTHNGIVPTNGTWGGGHGIRSTE